MKSAIVFGASGGIGSAIAQKLEEYRVTKITSKELDFNQSSNSVTTLLSQENPDLIVNAAGILGDNFIDFNTLFNINVRSNWEIIAHYRDHLPSTLVKFIMIGSSAYKSGRKDYMLYAASKAALHSLYQGASEYFKDSNLMLGIIHPSRVMTPMVSHLLKDNMNTNYLYPEAVAREIILFIEKMQQSTYVEIR